MKNIFFFLILAFCLSCKKEKTFDFPLGEWKLNAITYPVAFYNYNPIDGANGINSFSSSIGNKSCLLNYQGNNILTFITNGKEEIFKIKNVKKIEDSVFYHKTNNFLNGFISYELDLKNKKGKSFKFKYSLIRDTILVGEYWEKGQDYYRFDAPNIGEVHFYKYATGKTEIYNKEFLGVYHLKK